MAVVPSHPPERAMVFVDLMNVYESLGNLKVDTNIDYYKLALKLAGPQRRLIRCHVYTGAYDQAREPAKYSGQMKFFNRVHAMPFVTLKTRPLVSRGIGDGDLAPAVEAVKAAGKQIIVAAFVRSRSTAVANAADHEILLDGTFLTDCR